MRQFLVNVAIILFCISFVQCEYIGPKSQVIGRVEDEPLETTLSTTTYDTSDLFEQIFKLIITPDQKSHSEAKEHRHSEEKRIAKQLNVVLPSLPPFFERVRSFFKMAYKTYLLMNAEVKFGQCIVKYFYTQYPSVMKFFRMQNFSNFARRVYILTGKIMQNIVNAANIFSWPETEFDRQRIGMKVAMTASGKRVPMERLQPPLIYNYSKIVLDYSDYLNSHGGNTRYARQTNPPSSSNIIILPESDRGKGIEQIKPKENIQSYADIDSEARIDLTNRDLEREAENLFNIDSMFWRSLGIEENSFKRYSLAYCTKEYVTESFKRFMKNVILS